MSSFLKFLLPAAYKIRSDKILLVQSEIASAPRVHTHTLGVLILQLNTQLDG